jgi:hypothetical protein
MDIMHVDIETKKEPKKNGSYGLVKDLLNICRCNMKRMAIVVQKRTNNTKFRIKIAALAVYSPWN